VVCVERGREKDHSFFFSYTYMCVQINVSIKNGGKPLKYAKSNNTNNTTTCSEW
jgi:hypothetical protein